MTLIELVVALTITGLAVTGGYGAFAMLADRRAQATQVADEAQRSAGIRSTLVAWLSGARLTIEEDNIVFRGIDGVHHEERGDSPDDELTFFTSARTPLGNGGTIVRLFVERGDTTEHGLVAELSNRTGNQHMRLLIDPAVGALDAEYLSGALSSRAWISSWVSTTILPAGARLALQARAGDTLSPLLRAPITVSLENGR
jgi:hypothetical protein